ncbi:uncharacterized protein KGF55_000932 [Candida pseudojiufengensis]|uniref:uncharacterized protein n=1 Tax=Candida pseudojiufengensis TaxID=497109 RepID=UPI0022259106|nr:uncharacterized protein KGF55_000932 [Candida pseudojiufengensis]KAI5965570.1 hypothetical protein KGF55_000932 [Candida pseudojiufengensis]
MTSDIVRNKPLLHIKHNHQSTTTKQSETNSNSRTQSHLPEQNTSLAKISSNFKDFKNKISKELQRKGEDKRGNLKLDEIPRSLPIDPNKEFSRVQNQIPKDIEEHLKTHNDYTVIHYHQKPSGINEFPDTHYCPLDPNEIEYYQSLFQHQQENSSIPQPNQVEQIDVYEYLNPRHATNMTYNEKITNWLTSIPLVIKCNEDTNDGNVGPRYKFDCYPGTVSHSITPSDSSNADINLIDVDDIIEMQAQKVTKYVTRLYHNESEPNDQSIEDDCSDAIDEDDNESHYKLPPKSKIQKLFPNKGEN